MQRPRSIGLLVMITVLLFVVTTPYLTPSIAAPIKNADLDKHRLSNEKEKKIDTDPLAAASSVTFPMSAHEGDIAELEVIVKDIDGHPLEGSIIYSWEGHHPRALSPIGTLGKTNSSGILTCSIKFGNYPSIRVANLMIVASCSSPTDSDEHGYLFVENIQIAANYTTRVSFNASEEGISPTLLVARDIQGGNLTRAQVFVSPASLGAPLWNFEVGCTDWKGEHMVYVTPGIYDIWVTYSESEPFYFLRKRNQNLTTGSTIRIAASSAHTGLLKVNLYDSMGKGIEGAFYLSDISFNVDSNGVEIHSSPGFYRTSAYLAPYNDFLSGSTITITEEGYISLDFGGPMHLHTKTIRLQYPRGADVFFNVSLTDAYGNLFRFLNAQHVIEIFAPNGSLLIKDTFEWLRPLDSYLFYLPVEAALGNYSYHITINMGSYASVLEDQGVFEVTDIIGTKLEDDHFAVWTAQEYDAVADLTLKCLERAYPTLVELATNEAPSTRHWVVLTGERACGRLPELLPDWWVMERNDTFFLGCTWGVGGYYGWTADLADGTYFVHEPMHSWTYPIDFNTKGHWFDVLNHIEHEVSRRMGYYDYLERWATMLHAYYQSRDDPVDLFLHREVVPTYNHVHNAKIAFMQELWRYRFGLDVLHQIMKAIRSVSSDPETTVTLNDVQIAQLVAEVTEADIFDEFRAYNIFVETPVCENRTVLLLVRTESLPYFAIAEAYAKKAGIGVFPVTWDILEIERELALRNLVNNGLEKVVILGSENVISPKVEINITELGVEVERINGNDQYETSANFAPKMWPNGSKIVVISNGEWEYYLSAYALAASLNAPLLLTEGNGLSSAIVGAIQELGSEIAVMIGTADEISPLVEEYLETMGLATLKIPWANRVPPTKSLNTSSIIGYLKGLQTASGGFSTYELDEPRMKSTHYVISALDGLNVLHLIDREQVVDWIMSCQTVLGGFGGYPNDPFPFIDETYYVVKTLEMLDALDRINKSEVIEWLASAQNARDLPNSPWDDTGGFGELPDKRFLITRSSHVHSAYYAVAALKILNGLASINRDVLTYWLLECQNLIDDPGTPWNDTGGFGSQPDDTTSTLPDTFFALSALKELDALDRIFDLEAATDFILSCGGSEQGFNWNPNLEWSVAGPPYVYLEFTYMAVELLKMTDELDRLQFSSLLKWLYLCQNPDGGFGHSPLDTISCPEDTYWAVQTLQILRDVENRSIPSVEVYPRFLKDDNNFFTLHIALRNVGTSEDTFILKLPDGWVHTGKNLTFLLRPGECILVPLNLTTTSDVVSGYNLVRVTLFSLTSGETDSDGSLIYATVTPTPLWFKPQFLAIVAISVAVIVTVTVFLIMRKRQPLKMKLTRISWVQIQPEGSKRVYGASPRHQTSEPNIHNRET